MTRHVFVKQNLYRTIYIIVIPQYGNKYLKNTFVLIVPWYRSFSFDTWKIASEMTLILIHDYFFVTEKNCFNCATCKVNNLIRLQVNKSKKMIIYKQSSIYKFRFELLIIDNTFFRYVTWFSMHYLVHI